MSKARFEVKEGEDRGGVGEHHQQIHLHVEQCLAPEDDDELYHGEHIEEDAHDVNSLVDVLPFICGLIIAKRNGNSDVFWLCFKDYWDSNDLEDQAKELSLLEDARVLFHFEFNFNYSFNFKQY